MNIFLFKILIKNLINQIIKLFRRYRFEIVIDYNQANYYQFFLNIKFLIINNLINNRN